MKRLFKRVMLWKWIIVAFWRHSTGRTVFSLHDFPLTVLRFIRFEFNESGDEDLEAIRRLAFTTIRDRKIGKAAEEARMIGNGWF